MSDLGEYGMVIGGHFDRDPEGHAESERELAERRVKGYYARPEKPIKSTICAVCNANVVVKFIDGVPVMKNENGSIHRHD